MLIEETGMDKPTQFTSEFNNAEISMTPVGLDANLDTHEYVPYVQRSTPKTLDSVIHEAAAAEEEESFQNSQSISANQIYKVLEKD